MNARLKAALKAIQDTRLVAETFGLDEKAEVEQVAQLLMVAAGTCYLIIKIAMSS